MATLPSFETVEARGADQLTIQKITQYEIFGVLGRKLVTDYSRIQLLVSVMVERQRSFPKALLTQFDIGFRISLR